MLKTLAIIVVVVLVVIAGILIYASTKPDRPCPAHGQHQGAAVKDLP